MSSQEFWVPLLNATSGDVRRLDYVDRYSSIPVTLRETVSAHSYWVSLYATLIHQYLGGDKALYGAIALHANTHDLIECITGDVVRTFKYSSPEVKAAVDTAEEILFPKLPGQIQSLYSLWQELAGDQKQYVKAVVKAADFISLHQYMIREMARGNTEITPFLTRMKVDLIAEGFRLSQNPDVRISGMSGLFDLMSNTSIPGSRTAG